MPPRPLSTRMDSLQSALRATPQWHVRQLALVVLLGAVSPAGAVIKCWTNSDGVKECGNAVPAEYAQQGHEVKSEGGMVLSRQPPARSVDEITAERLAREAREAEEARRKAVEDARLAEDRMLIDTFDSEDDLLLARDGQISSLEAQVRMAQGMVGKLEKTLADMVAHAAQIERSGQALPEDLARNVALTQRQIAEQQDVIAARRAEQDTVRASFARDLARFRELRGSAPN